MSGINQGKFTWNEQNEQILKEAFISLRGDAIRPGKVRRKMMQLSGIDVPERIINSKLDKIREGAAAGKPLNRGDQFKEEFDLQTLRSNKNPPGQSSSSSNNANPGNNNDELVQMFLDDQNPGQSSSANPGTAYTNYHFVQGLENPFPLPFDQVPRVQHSDVHSSTICGLREIDGKVFKPNGKVFIKPNGDFTKKKKPNGDEFDIQSFINNARISQVDQNQHQGQSSNANPGTPITNDFVNNLLQGLGNPLPLPVDQVPRVQHSDVHNKPNGVEFDIQSSINNAPISQVDQNQHQGQSSNANPGTPITNDGFNNLLKDLWDVELPCDLVDQNPGQSSSANPETANTDDNITDEDLNHWIDEHVTDEYLTLNVFEDDNEQN